MFKLLLCNGCKTPVKIHGKRGALVHITCPGCGLDSSKDHKSIKHKQPEIIIMNRRSVNIVNERI